MLDFWGVSHTYQFMSQLHPKRIHPFESKQQLHSVSVASGRSHQFQGLHLKLTSEQVYTSKKRPSMAFCPPKGDDENLPSIHFFRCELLLVSERCVHRKNVAESFLELLVCVTTIQNVRAPFSSTPLTSPKRAQNRYH